MNYFDCLVIGGGPAGIGVGSVLKDLNVEKYCILERGRIGASFQMWPREMRMITPSFTSNAYGMTDLNSVVLNTSPAYTLGTEHPSGKDYAEYLNAVAVYKKLPIKTGIDVTEIIPLSDGGFELKTSSGKMFSKNIVWAAGEFQYPKLDGFPGAEYAIHNSLIDKWTDIEGDEIIVIGGYESGADAAIHLSRIGKKVKLIDRNGHWLEKGSSDPSVELSPFTKDRLKEVNDGEIELIAGYEVHWIEPANEGGYLIYCENKEGQNLFVKTKYRPILATGFNGSLSLVKHLFEHDERGVTKLTDSDESTITPGLFVCGPSVIHGNLKFCFIYKFRQRFGVVAGSIAERLKLDTKVLEDYRKQGMLLTDLSCCQENCTC